MVIDVRRPHRFPSSSRLEVDQNLMEAPLGGSPPIGSVHSCQTPMAEGVGFEPTVPCDTTVFETVRFVRSRIPPAGLSCSCGLPGLRFSSFSTVGPSAHEAPMVQARWHGPDPVHPAGGTGSACISTPSTVEPVIGPVGFPRVVPDGALPPPAGARPPTYTRMRFSSSRVVSPSCTLTKASICRVCIPPATAARATASAGARCRTSARSSSSITMTSWMASLPR